MKTIIFEKILLISLKEKRARAIALNPGLNIIKGENDCGKSSVLKSIYGLLGAEVDSSVTTWHSTEIHGIIYFSFNNRKYIFLKAYGRCALFDENKSLLTTFKAYPQEYADFFTKYLQCKILLEDKHLDLQQATPSAILMPFYVDQDNGWHDPWKSFSGLSAFKSCKNDVLDYYIGLRTQEYMESKHNLRVLEKKFSSLRSQRRALRETIDQLKSNFTDIHSKLGLLDFKKDLKDLLAEYQELSFQQDLIKNNVQSLNTHKIELELHLKMAREAQQEVLADYTFATEKAGNVVECAMCGATYANSIAQVFKLADFEEHCFSISHEYVEKLEKVNQDLEELTSQNSTIAKKISEIETILNEQRGNVKLKDIIIDIGKKKINDVIDNQYNEVMTEFNDTALKLRYERENFQRIQTSNAERKQDIKETYISHMKLFLPELGVHNISEKQYHSWYKKVSATGSSKPRVLLAYYFSFMQLIFQYCQRNTIIFPFIMDSPKQQGPSEQTWKKILSFIPKHLPHGAQMILGLVDEEASSIDGSNIILFEEKWHGLVEADYKENLPLFQNLVDEMQKDFSDLPLFNP